MTTTAFIAWLTLPKHSLISCEIALKCHPGNFGYIGLKDLKGAMSLILSIASLALHFIVELSLLQYLFLGVIPYHHPHMPADNFDS